MNLYKAVDDIKDRFGAKLVSKAVTSQLKDNDNEYTTKHNKKRKQIDGELSITTTPVISLIFVILKLNKYVPSLERLPRKE